MNAASDRATPNPSAALSVAQPPVDAIWRWLADVPDPEIPVISVVDLGIVRDVRWEVGEAGAELRVTITPTYSGCPATEVIAESIRTALADHGLRRVRLEQRLAPAWTTDWLSDRGRENLEHYGIAPPAARAGEQVIDISRILKRSPATMIACPQCGSSHTRLVSRFGSTPCKALYRCDDCLEPFDYFKPH